MSNDKPMSPEQMALLGELFKESVPGDLTSATADFMLSSREAVRRALGTAARQFVMIYGENIADQIKGRIHTEFVVDGLRFAAVRLSSPGAPPITCRDAISGLNCLITREDYKVLVAARPKLPRELWQFRLVVHSSGFKVGGVQRNKTVFFREGGPHGWHVYALAMKDNLDSDCLLIVRLP